VDYFDNKNNVLNGVIIVEWNNDGKLVRQIRANRAEWNGKNWVFTNAVSYQWQGDAVTVADMSAAEEKKNDYTEEPSSFRRGAVSAEELSTKDVKGLVHDLRQAGLPYTEALCEYYHRYSFSFVSFIVIILSISMGGRFRKNIMLMSLLASLGTAVVYYVIEMITMMLGRMGYIPPVVGAWFPVGLFTIVGIVLTRYSKT
jgi:lipopolysaccharide export system permease protein